VWHQARYQNRIFWRTREAAFFTLALPVMFLVLFNLLFGGPGSINLPGMAGPVSTAQFYAPALAVFAAATATYTNLSVNVSVRRDQGILKRARGTPLPPWIYMAGAIVSSVWIAALGTLIMMTLGVVAYDVDIDLGVMLAAFVAFVFGVACFATLGLALAALVPSGTSASAVANATLLPLAFISNVFIPLDDPPRWLEVVGGIFPLKRFVDAFSTPFNPFTQGGGWRPFDLLVIAAWAVAGLIVTLKFFRWEPHPGVTSRRSRKVVTRRS